MKPVRIVNIIEHLDIGGEEKLLFNLAPALQAEGFKIYVITFMPGSMDKALMDRGVPLITIKTGSKIRRLIELIKILKKIRPDIIHTRLFSAGFWGRAAGYAAGVPILLHTHAGFTFRSKKLKRIPMEFLLSLITDATICVSEGVKKHIKKYLKINQTKLFMIPNGISVKSLFALSLKSIKKPACLIIAGRLEHVKGQDIIIRALALIPNNLCKVLLIAGEGSRGRQLERLAARLGVGERVKFLGARNDIPSLLAQADIYIAPSRSEGLPVAVLEAMASGLPVIASNITGHREVLSKTGEFFPAEDYKALAQKIIMIINNLEKSLQKAVENRARVAEYYTFDKMVKAYSDLYSRFRVRKNQRR